MEPRDGDREGLGTLLGPEGSSARSVSCWGVGLVDLSSGLLGPILTFMVLQFWGVAWVGLLE